MITDEEEIKTAIPPSGFLSVDIITGIGPLLSSRSLILTAYLLFAAMPLLGFPWTMIAPAFLVMPFALLQILWMQRIAQGAPPNWKFLKILAYSVIGLTLYILTLTFWMR